MKIQLLYLDGCPNLERARIALREALAAERIDERVEEIDVAAPGTPDSMRGWGSPTILVDGADVIGGAGWPGTACRLYPDGAPSVEQVRTALAVARRSPARRR